MRRGVVGVENGHKLRCRVKSNRRRGAECRCVGDASWRKTKECTAGWIRERSGVQLCVCDRMYGEL